MRGQTPKQPKQDKVRKPVGRSRRRVLYLHRLVNPKLGSNGKRIYNSHSI